MKLWHEIIVNLSLFKDVCLVLLSTINLTPAMRGSLDASFVPVEQLGGVGPQDLGVVARFSGAVRAGGQLSMLRQEVYQQL